MEATCKVNTDNDRCSNTPHFSLTVMLYFSDPQNTNFRYLFDLDTQEAPQNASRPHNLGGPPLALCEE